MASSHLYSVELINDNIIQWAQKYNLLVEAAVTENYIVDTPDSGSPSITAISSKWADDHTNDLEAHGISSFGASLVSVENESELKSLINLEIGTDVQAYDANTAKYDSATANFTGNLQKSGNDVFTTASTIPIVNGGTGGTSVAAARSNLGLGAAAVKNVTGLDSNAVTGTAGSNNNLAKWDSNGDLIDGPTPPNGTIVGTTDTQTLTNKTLTSPTINSPIINSSTINSPTINNGYVEETSTSVPSTLNTANGTIQAFTLSSNWSPSDSLSSGESITIIVNSAGNTITFPTTTWITGAGSAPIFPSGTWVSVTFTKVGSTLYAWGG